MRACPSASASMEQSVEMNHTKNATVISVDMTELDRLSIKPCVSDIEHINKAIDIALTTIISNSNSRVDLDEYNIFTETYRLNDNNL